MNSALLVAALQFVVAAGLINVWLIRARRETEFRGGDAQTLQSEFATYGLPAWSFYLVGVLKLGAAVALALGFWLPQLVGPASLLVSALMVGAIAMHVRVGDPAMKALPATLMLVMSLGIVFLG